MSPCLRVEWLKVNVPVGGLTEDNLEQCCCPVRGATSGTHSGVRGQWQSAQETCSREIYTSHGRKGLDKRRGWVVVQLR